MFLHKIHLNPQNREARRDLVDPYEMHSTLCRAFSPPGNKCPSGEFLWRLEPETDKTGNPRIIIQSRSLPDWTRIGVNGWLAEDPPAGIDIRKQLNLDSLKSGARFRYRLRANPAVTRNGKRQGLFRTQDQEVWLERKGREQHGFALPSLPRSESADAPRRIAICVTQERMLRGQRRGGADIRVFSVLYDGLLNVTEPEKFIAALQNGIGHGKTMGLGLLSIAPVL